MSRALLFDEVALRDPTVRYGYRRPTAAEVADLYRQLRANLESNKQEIEAGDFFIGQMDMRRQERQLGRLHRQIGLPAYRILALYGESRSLPLLFFVLGRWCVRVRVPSRRLRGGFRTGTVRMG